MVLPIVYAPSVNLGISKALIVNLAEMNYESHLDNEPLELNFIFVNSGNIPFKSRGRLDIFDGTRKIFTGWSEETILRTGQIRRIPIYWFPYSTEGKFRGVLKIYYGTEVMEGGEFEFEVVNTEIPEKIINITKLRTYDNEMVLTLSSHKHLEDVIIIPVDYPPGWFFEQKGIGKLNGSKKIELIYEPSFWEPGNEIKFQVVTKDGKYYGEKTFKIEKEGILSRFIYYSSKRIERFFKNL
ncbi:MAG: hypothetical protein GF368_03545 [Candidatus Aenigmarchaeota archaeon]|nr:hypothetical protein [Candidatus Aenigmarchaeota archaeon]